MGYTHYFELKADLTDEVLKDVNKVLQKYPNIVFECDTNEPPLISKKLIRFNGRGENGYETFYLKPYFSNSCKTEYKPYDLAVCEVLLVLKHHYRDKFDLSSDGFYVYEDEFERKELDGYWNDALENVKTEFGYEFSLKGVVESSGNYTYYSFEIF